MSLPIPDALKSLLSSATNPADPPIDTPSQTDLAATSLLEMASHVSSSYTNMADEWVSGPSSRDDSPTKLAGEDPQADVELERSFCSDFQCCGVQLADMHELLKHYEESHVKVEEEDEWSGRGNQFGYGGRVDGAGAGTHASDLVSGNSGQGRVVAVGVEPQDVALDAPSAFDTTVFRTVPLTSNYYYSHSSTPVRPTTSSYYITPTTAPQQAFYCPAPTQLQTGYKMPPGVISSTGSFGIHPGAPRPPTINTHSFSNNNIPISTNFYPSTAAAPNTTLHRPFPFSPIATTNYHPLHAINIPKRPRSAPVSFAADPHALNTLRSVLPSAFSHQHENPLHLIHTALSSTINPPRKPIHVSKTDTEGDGENRPYVCKLDGCGKSYKNANGLKYHSIHGHEREGKDANGEEFRQYSCPFTGCLKRYKNPNGLKYHVQHGHPGQTPPLRNTMAPLKSISKLDQIEAAIKREQINRGMIPPK